MKHLKTNEIFSIGDYVNSKKEKEKLLIQELGDEFIIDIIKNEDFNGLKYLLKTGYKLRKCGTVENLLVIALSNNKYKMFDYLLDNYDTINSIYLLDIIQKNYDVKNIVSRNQIEILKKITEKGYNFEDSNYNYFELYLVNDEYAGNNTYKKTPYQGLISFIDWLFKNYPKYYKLFKNIELPEKLRNKYKYLENSNKYNL
jgi:hypothetical protein